VPRLKQQPQKPAALAGKIPVIVESEKAILSAAFKDNEVAQQVATELTEEAFSTDLHKALWLAIKSLCEESLVVTPVSVAERSGVKLVQVEPIREADHGNPQTLIKELNRVAELRRVWEACLNYCSTVGVDSKPEEITATLEGAIYGKDSNGKEASDGSEVLNRVKGQFIHRAGLGGQTQVSTGLAALDKAIISLHGPKVVVIAARPSVGKTALSSTIRRALLNQDLGVFEVNLEMGEEEIAERELAYQSSLNLRKILSAKDVSPEELAKVQGVNGGLFSGLWFIDDRTSNIVGIRRKARLVAGRLSRQGKRLGAVILDYLQLAGDNGEGREQSIAAISRGCKLMAKELRCPVLVLSQLNRSCEYREDRRPILSDLRESGAIEQDADTVIFIYRGHLYEESIPPEETELIIRKQRSGPIGTVRVKYNPQLVTFHD
jgi:replicative DNA helicase